MPGIGRSLEIVIPNNVLNPEAPGWYLCKGGERLLGRRDLESHREELLKTR
jgi:hypothetical protein